MTSIKEVNWHTIKDDQLNNDVLRRHRDEDFRDDDVLSSDRISDSKLPTIGDADDDDANLSNDDKRGRDLDVENGDEWDAGDFGDDLDRTDFDDDDEINADKHRIKSDQFGSLASSIKNDNSPDPDEIPEEHEVGNEEVADPDSDGLEKGTDNEADYQHEKEVTPPKPEHERETTLNTLDPSFIGVEHSRKTERIVDHEPGAAGDRRAPNL